MKKIISLLVATFIAGGLIAIENTPFGAPNTLVMPEFTPEEEKELQEIERKIESYVKVLRPLWKRQSDIINAAEARQGTPARQPEVRYLNK